MKKLLVVCLLAAGAAGCHYGTEDAKKSLDTNEKYKSDKVDYSTNRGNDGVMPPAEAGTAPVEEAPAATADTVKHEEHAH